MADEITYYAIVNNFSTREEPRGVLRRINDERGERDEIFGPELKWEFSPLLIEYEHGELGTRFYPISAEEAERIVQRIRDGAPYEDL
jgi:hypothetical protein